MKGPSDSSTTRGPVFAVNRAKSFHEMTQPSWAKMVAGAEAIFFDLGETLVTQNIEDNMVKSVPRDHVVLNVLGDKGLAQIEEDGLGPCYHFGPAWLGHFVEGLSSIDREDWASSSARVGGALHFFACLGRIPLPPSPNKFDEGKLTFPGEVDRSVHV